MLIHFVLSVMCDELISNKVSESTIIDSRLTSAWVSFRFIVEPVRNFKHSCMSLHPTISRSSVFLIHLQSAYAMPCGPSEPSLRDQCVTAEQGKSTPALLRGGHRLKQRNKHLPGGVKPFFNRQLEVEMPASTTNLYLWMPHSL